MSLYDTSSVRPMRDGELLGAIAAYKTRERCGEVLSERDWHRLGTLKAEAFRRGLRYWP